MAPPTSGSAAPIRDATDMIGNAVEGISDRLWQFELAALAAKDPSNLADARSKIGNLARQLAASVIAIASFAFVLMRYGGTPAGRAKTAMAGASHLVALHAEDTTRTRHLRNALVRHQSADPQSQPIILLLGRPSANAADGAQSLDPKSELRAAQMLRPLSLGSFLRSLPHAGSQLVLGMRETGRYRGAIPFRERVAIAYRMVQGAAHAAWWARAVSSSTQVALFGHTGTADTSMLEIAMQASGVRTMHVVHGTSIGWPFAGLSDVAMFPSGADARLGASLPAYGLCTHLALDRPEVSQGNGEWALLTSYTHLQHPSYDDEGAGLDLMLIDLIREAARSLGQDPAKIYWRPHPQIELVKPAEKARLVKAVEEAGFTRWLEDRPYARLDEFSAIITTPSTVLTDALRLGQPAIVVSLSPLQRDLLYSAHPLLVEYDQHTDCLPPLIEAIRTVLDPHGRKDMFGKAWEAINPGAAPSIDALLGAMPPCA